MLAHHKETANWRYVNQKSAIWIW